MNSENYTKKYNLKVKYFGKLHHLALSQPSLHPSWRVGVHTGLKTNVQIQYQLYVITPTGKGTARCREHPKEIVLAAIIQHGIMPGPHCAN